MTKAEKLIVRMYLESEENIVKIKDKNNKHPQGLSIKISNSDEAKISVWIELRDRFRYFLKTASQKS